MCIHALMLSHDLSLSRTQLHCVGKYKDLNGIGNSLTECDKSCPDHTTSPLGSDALIDCICNSGYTGENGIYSSVCLFVFTHMFMLSFAFIFALFFRKLCGKC